MFDDALMNVTIVKTSADQLTLDQVEKLVDDIWDAWEYYEKNDYQINIVVEGLSKTGKFVYRKLTDFSELDGRQQQVMMRCILEPELTTSMEQCLVMEVDDE